MSDPIVIDNNMIVGAAETLKKEEAKVEQKRKDLLKD